MCRRDRHLEVTIGARSEREPVTSRCRDVEGGAKTAVTRLASTLSLESVGRADPDDVGLAVAAQRLVEQSLGVVPGERVLIVHDEARADLADAITRAVTDARSEPLAFCLERLGARPHGSLYAVVAEAIGRAQASVLVTDFQGGELGMRTELIERATRGGLRHGHIVGVSRASMIAGFSVDPRRVAARARELSVRLRDDSRIVVKSERGTDLEIGFAPSCRWVDFGCLVARGRRVNLPGGELVASPATIGGIYVADGTLGDADGALGRSLASTPLTFTIQDGRVKSVTCRRDPNLARTVVERLARTVNLDRVGLVGFGVNIGLGEPLGDIFTDQKVPGVHLSLGETFPEQTGASWTASSWVAVTATELDVDIDKSAVLRRGRYIL